MRIGGESLSAMIKESCTYMDDDIVDLLVVIIVAGIGFIALAYLVSKAYADQIKIRLLWCKKRKRPIIIVPPSVITEQRPKSALAVRKIGVIDGPSVESNEKTLTSLNVPSRKQLTKRVRINAEVCKVDLESPSSSVVSRIYHLSHRPFSSCSKALIERRRTL